MWALGPSLAVEVPLCATCTMKPAALLLLDLVLVAVAPGAKRDRFLPGTVHANVMAVGGPRRMPRLKGAGLSVDAPGKARAAPLPAALSRLHFWLPRITIVAAAAVHEGRLWSAKCACAPEPGQAVQGGKPNASNSALATWIKLRQVKFATKGGRDGTVRLTTRASNDT